jgi:hypothetical protein
MVVVLCVDGGDGGGALVAVHAVSIARSPRDLVKSNML